MGGVSTYTSWAVFACLGLTGAGCGNASGHGGWQNPDLPTSAGAQAEAPRLFKATSVKKGADGKVASSTILLTADQMELQKQARAAWIEKRTLGQIVPADLTLNPGCPFVSDDVWVYDGPNRTGNLCCISGTGASFLGDHWDDNGAGRVVEDGLLCGFDRAQSLWGGAYQGYVWDDWTDCIEHYQAWEIIGVFGCYQGSSGSSGGSFAPLSPDGIGVGD
jgi:hypothetical protein